MATEFNTPFDLYPSAFGYAMPGAAEAHAGLDGAAPQRTRAPRGEQHVG